MSRVIHRKLVVRKGGVLRLKDSSLPAGKAVEVIIRVEDEKASLPPLRGYFGAGRGLFSSPEEVDAYIREERKSWD